MQSISAVTFFATLALCLPIGSQDKPAQPQREPSAQERLKSALDKIRTQMQGAWRLEELRTPSQSQERRREVGICLVTGNYMSLELHIGWISDRSRIDAKDFQSGTYRFEVIEGGMVEMSTMIGSFMNSAQLLQFEEPNTVRRFQIEVKPDSMTLRRNDGQQFGFVRLPDDRLRHLEDMKAGNPKEKAKPGPDDPPR